MDNLNLSLPAMRLVSHAKIPSRAHAEDADLDLYALEAIELPAFGGSMAKTGVAIKLPHQTVGMIQDRSSMAKKGVKTVGGIIDEGYRGEICVLLRNLTAEIITIAPGDRIAQLLIIPIVRPQAIEVTTLDETSRGGNGFGSSGR